MTDRPRTMDQRDTTVRTRLAWGGTGLALVGICAAGLGLGSGHPWVAWFGAGVTLVGLLAAWRGGVLYDTRGQEPPHDEPEELRHGGEHRGVSPSDRLTGADAQATAAAATHDKQVLLARTGTVPRPPLRRPAALLLVGTGAWLFVSRWALDYPFTVTGQNSALRDTGFVVLIVLTGLRLRLETRSLVASGLSLLCGLGLVASALLLPHDSSTVSGNELVTGVLVVVLTAVTFS